jgi:putative inorganic carbon (HCO3(-)) transporter
MLRTIFVLAIVILGTRVALQNAFGGLLLYLWVAYFRPEHWVYVDFIATLNLSFIAGTYLVFRSIFSGADFRIDLRRGLLLVFGLQTVMSTAMSDYVMLSSAPFQDFMKVLVITFLMTSLIDTPHRFRIVLLVIGFSLGLENAKQGWATLILRPGGKNANPVASLGDENETAVGLLMLTPLILAVAHTATRPFEKRIAQFFALGVAYRAISTYSRGGFLTAGAMALVHVARSKQKFQTAVITIAVVGTFLSVMPDSFWDRMSTITTDESELEASAASRPHFWRVATAMAGEHPIMGIGHFAFQVAYDDYDFLDGRFGRARAVHSSWFGVLSELGYVGLALFIALVGLSVIGTQKVIRRAQKGEIPLHFRHYGVALQTGLAAFLVGGSFVTYQYREILWHYFALSFALYRLANTAAVTAASERAFAASTSPVGRAEPVRRRA